MLIECAADCRASIVLCDTHGPAPWPSDREGIAHWSRRWNGAIFKLKGSSSQFSTLQSAELATRPPQFGNPVYNIGGPLGTQLKVSPNAHVLRHALSDDNNDAFSNAIAGYGTFTTDLDQFPGGCSLLNEPFSMLTIANRQFWWPSD